MYNIKVDYNNGHGFGDHITFELCDEEDMQFEIIDLLSNGYNVQIKLETDNE